MIGTHIETHPERKTASPVDLGIKGGLASLQNFPHQFSVASAQTVL